MITTQYYRLIKSSVSPAQAVISAVIITIMFVLSIGYLRAAGQMVEDAVD